METEKKTVYVLVKSYIYDYASETHILGVSLDKNEIQKIYEKERQQEIDRFLDEYGNNIETDGTEKWKIIENEQSRDYFEIFLKGYAVDDSCTLFIESEFKI